MKSLKVLNLSTSSMKTYEQCPRKFYFHYVANVDIPKKEWPHTQFGSFLHHVLEDFHNALLADPNLNQKKLMRVACEKFHEQFKIDSDQQTMAMQILKSYMDDIDKNGLPPIVSNEQKFKIEIEENLTVNGYIDRIEKHGDEYVICDYKGLALNTPIPTPSGWTTMEMISAGDFVLGSNGRPIKVTAKSQIHNRTCYKITLSDNSEVVCDNVHLWKVEYVTVGKNKHYENVFSADQLYEKFIALKIGSFAIHNVRPLDLPDALLPINPWLLGAWLGDGLSKTGSFTVGKQDFSEMKDLFKKHWGTISSFKDKARDVYTITCTKPEPAMCSRFHIVSENRYCKECSNGKLDTISRKNIPLSKILRKYNLIHNKHIPNVYLRGSFDQRLSLLQGLMDTDGSWNPLRKRAVFISAKKELADSVSELIRTFGVTVQRFTKTDKNGFTHYKVEFRPVGFNPFQLPRKANKVLLSFPDLLGKRTVFALRRTIKNIEKIESVPTQCITVDADDSLYLCGTGMIPTHNSGKSQYLDEFQLLVYGLYLLDRYPDLKQYSGNYLMLKEGMKKLSYTFTREDLEKVIQKIKDIAEQIRSDKTWEPKTHFILCRYCDYVDICDAAPKKGSSKDLDWT